MVAREIFERLKSQRPPAIKKGKKLLIPFDKIGLKYFSPNASTIFPFVFYKKKTFFSLMDVMD